MPANKSKRGNNQNAASPNLPAETVANIVKPKRKGPTPGTRPDRAAEWELHAEPGEISRIVNNAVSIARWDPIDTNDPDQIIDRINQYHDYCIQNDVKPDMSGLALAMGTSRSTLWKWENGVESNKPQAVRNALKKGREINEYILVTMMQNGKINPIPALFLLKNNFSYKDVQDVVVTPNNPLDTGDADQTRQKYLEALPEIASDE